MRTAVHVDDAERVPARLVDDCHVSRILGYLTGTRADHDPWRADRQAVRVRINVALDIFVLLGPSPRVIRNQPIRRIHHQRGRCVGYAIAGPQLETAIPIAQDNDRHAEAVETGHREVEFAIPVEVSYR